MGQNRIGVHPPFKSYGEVYKIEGNDNFSLVFALAVCIVRWWFFQGGEGGGGANNTTIIF